MRFWGKKRRRGALAPEDWPEDGWHFLPGSFSMTEKDVPQGYALYTFAPNMGEEGWETVRAACGAAGALWVQPERQE